MDAGTMMANGRVRAGALAVVAMIVLGAGWGCTKRLNNEVSVGQSWLPPSLDAREEAIAPVIETQPMPKPSITSLDRSGWETTPIVLANDRTAHQPRYTRPWFATRYRDVEKRRLGTYPTMDSALQMPAYADDEAQAREGLVSPVAAAVDIVLFPIRAIASRPWQRTRTGNMPYDRSPPIPRTLPIPEAEPREAPEAPPMAPAEPLYGEENMAPAAPKSPETPAKPTPPPSGHRQKGPIP